MSIRFHKHLALRVCQYELPIQSSPPLYMRALLLIIQTLNKLATIFSFSNPLTEPPQFSLKQFYAHIIMQQLFSILSHKLSLITTHSTPQSNSQKDHLLDQLLIQKKKQNLRILVETRLQQSIDNRKISTTEDLNWMIEKLHRTMSIYDQDIPLPQREDSLVLLVQLFVSFFNRQGCGHRAQEISNIHKKKLCPKGLLPSTLFNWFVEWTRKQFQQFLKTRIHSLYVSSKQSSHQGDSLKNSPRNHQKEQTKEDLMEELLQVKKKHPQLLQSRTIATSSYRQKRSVMTIEVEEKKPAKMRIKSLSPTQNSLQEELQGTIDPEESYPINKQVFFNAYAEELQVMYKTFQSCIPDLDMAFMRKFRKGGRRKQVKQRIKEVANNIIKYMTNIKEAIDKYSKQYGIKHNNMNNSIKRRKNRLQRYQNSISPSRTSQGNRSNSSDNIIDERRMKLISSLGKKHRYGEQYRQISTLNSNLLPEQQKRHPIRRREEQISKTIDLTLISPNHKNQSKIFFLNSGSISAELEIIHEKKNNIKAKPHKKHSIGHKKSQTRQRNAFSKSFGKSQDVQIAFSNLPITMDLCQSSHVRLPRIRKMNK